MTTRFFYPRLGHLAATMQVVQALIFRELRTRFGQYHLGYLWAFAEPLAHVAVLSAIFGIRSPTTTGGVEFPVFLATGLIPFLLFRGVVLRAMSAVESNKALFNYRQVKPLDTLIARTLLEALVYGAVFVVFMTGAGWLGFDAAVQRPLQVLIVFVALALFGLGIGAMACVLASLLPDIAQVVPIILRPFYFISGVFFSVERVPAEYRDYLLWNPLLHAIEIVHQGYFFEVTASYGDPLYLAWWVLGSLALGLLTFQAFRFRLVAT